ncbi:hypothetical protein DLAC_11640 [Tieghemostelium lacteum]|uniref:Mitochondrial substrate carrier family protein n=1 Tax=Tieghemostelium lacteum TaxID=361077 RepID=A0A151ZH57_TIELA|nr:hypothetical protein DLAC_11640 [Tieghemostelium lacteum]|eukprot:KYQ93210.1 hypothetical protein DLAC_11640 [Tieghemostelium lacteum]
MTNETTEIKKGLSITLVGAISGLVADSIMHPIDTIRARLQVEKVGKSQYNGTFHAMNMILKNEGVKYLYKGFPIVATATVPAHALYFYGYEESKRILSSTFPQWGSGSLGHFISGFVADAFGSLVWVPMDIIKQRLQVQTNTQKLNPNQTLYKGSFHAANVIFKEEGIKGFYRGFWPALLTFGPYVGIYFTVYEKSKSLLSKYYFGEQYTLKNQPTLPIYYQLCSGFFAGSVGAGLTCPLDVIKTRIQVQRKSDTQQYKGIYDAAKTILREEGYQAFIKGMGARIMWIAPGSALTIAACMYILFYTLFLYLKRT